MLEYRVVHRLMTIEQSLRGAAFISVVPPFIGGVCREDVVVRLLYQTLSHRRQKKQQLLFQSLVFQLGIGQ